MATITNNSYPYDTLVFSRRFYLRNAIRIICNLNISGYSLDLKIGILKLNSDFITIFIHRSNRVFSAPVILCNRMRRRLNDKTIDVLRSFFILENKMLDYFQILFEFLYILLTITMWCFCKKFLDLVFFLCYTISSFSSFKKIDFQNCNVS